MANTIESSELKAAIALSLEFLNSEWGDFRGRWRVEELSKPEWLSAFLAKWHLEINDAPTESDISALIALRTLMLKIVVSLPFSGPSKEDLASLNDIFRAAPSIRRLWWQNEQFELTVEPLEKNWRWVMTEIVASFAITLVYGDLQRLKICENPACRFKFYDETRSRTRRWCTNETCGNLWKMRRFRARMKTAFSD